MLIGICYMEFFVFINKVLNQAENTGFSEILLVSQLFINQGISFLRMLCSLYDSIFVIISLLTKSPICQQQQCQQRGGLCHYGREYL